MRKHQQRQILELIQTIREVQAAGLYADCQDCAVVVGEYVESVAGEGTGTVALLEEYCDLLFKASNGEVGEKTLKKHLYKVENSVKSELKPTRTEIVFLSYKASMSDSIESIYHAAKSDPCCDTYWLPVPYYEVKAVGSVGEMHYEGADCYSSNIECCDWQEYDIEDRNPDVIFTFNPYDSGNLVTRIHPDFYCERLCNLTDLLIYIPYFVASDDVLEHFCTVDGCRYADKVILQSEKIREKYIKVFKESYGGQFGKPEDKFIALGSPKYDKMVNSKQEDYILPASWDKLMSGKKVILYNTAVAVVLQYNEHYLKKLSYVFELFRKRDDVVLWWRPHPLCESTFASMRPRLLDEYRKLIIEYKNSGWGIYDDTENLHRALTWADAYYGDWSSLVMMYLATGKPVMTQDICISSLAVYDITFSWFTYIDNNLWSSSLHYSAIIKMNADTWQTEFIGSFPNEMSGRVLYSKPAESGGCIYYPPSTAAAIGVYSIADGTIKGIPYRKNDIIAENELAFTEAVSYGKEVFFTPFMYPAIMRLDTQTNEITYISCWLEPMKKLIGDVQDSYFHFPVTVGDVIMLPACGTNAVLEFDMASQDCTIHEVGKKGYRYGGICYDGVSYWLSPRFNTPVVKWNPHTGETKEFHGLCSNDDDKQIAFLSAVYCGGYVWLLPHRGEHAYKIDALSDEVSISGEFEPVYLDEQDKPEMGSMKYHLVQVFGDSIIAHNAMVGTLVEWNCKTKARREERVRFTPDSVTKLAHSISKSFIKNPDDMKTEFDCCYKELRSMRLSDYLNYLTAEDRFDGEEEMIQKRKEIALSLNANAVGTSGAVIYEYVKESILKGKT